ncbi:mitochondrial carrier domain-containing protein [Limtongia smithiae]|uniref:mitochondrial carrier domain-containing protein n=1 Tax=Limtongia smithiae TaxID=1125753 RepID=UPI0034CE0564
MSDSALSGPANIAATSSAATSSAHSLQKHFRKSNPDSKDARASLLIADEDAEVEHEKEITRAYISNKGSYDYIIRSGIAGGVAGCAAKTLIAPLDRVKILFQTSSPEFLKYSGKRHGVYRAARMIYQNDGVLGLFQGHSATLLRIFPYAAIKFVVYEQLRAAIITDPSQETNFRRILSGSLAGVTSVFFTYPLELIRVRLAYESKKAGNAKLMKICKHIYQEGHTGATFVKPAAPATSTMTSTAAITPAAIVQRPMRGLQNFYRGFSATVIGILPYAGVSFWTHDTVHDILRSRYLARYTVSNGLPSADRHVPLVIWAQLAAGGIAGMVSQSASYPLEVIRRRMQVGGLSANKNLNTIASTAKVIFAEHGIRGFFVGLTIGYVKVIPMVSCSFFVYERMKFFLNI